MTDIAVLVPGRATLTPQEVFLWAVIIVMISSTVAVLISWAFCTRPVPRWVRQWRDVALAIVAARWVVRDTGVADLDPWWAAVVWMNLGIAQASVAAFNFRYILPPYRDTCRQNVVTTRKRRIVTTLIIAILLLIPLGVMAQEDCPEGYYCVAYENSILEIDPAGGPYQLFIVEERTVIRRTLDATITTEEVVGVGYEFDGQSYAQTETHTLDKDGLFDDATLGDVYLLGKAGS